MNDSTSRPGSPGAVPDRPSSPSSSDAADVEVLRRGAVVDRYVVLEQIGMGGMGVVYAAYDPELDRKLALKLVRPEREGTAIRARLLREAQALARLSHPNVLTVHDVGTFGEQVFLALEFVEGESLAQWLRRESHPWQRVLEVFQEVGRGLAAAHRAGVVHRDFKPANVVLGEDGRPRVLDFGMARTAGVSQWRVREVDVPSSPTPGSLDLPLTQDGQVVGTLPYMAPEMPREEEVDARSDQFSFCVALYEALYGEHPFANPGESTLVLIDRMLRAEVKPPPVSTEIPGWVRSALLRGLAVDPAARHPSMEALLVALQDRPWRRRRPLVMAAAGTILVVALGGLLWRAGEPLPPACSSLEVRLAEIWSGSRAAHLEARFAAESAGSLETWQRLEERLEHHSQNWRATLRSSCRQAQARRLSPDLFDRRLHCLERQLDRLAAFTDLLEHPVGGDLSETLHRIARPTVLDNVLVESGDCMDEDLLQGIPARHLDPVAEERVRGLERVLAESEVWTDVGLHRQALPEVLAAAREARRLEAPRLGASALLLAGEIQRWQHDPDAARRSLLDALSRAEESRDDRLAARVLIRLVWLDGVDRGDAEQTASWVQLAEAKISRVPGPSWDLRALLAQAAGTALLHQGRLTEARRRLEVASGELSTEAEAALSRAQIVDALGSVLLELGEPREALDRYRRAVRLRRRALGVDHPLVALSRDHVGSALRLLGQPEEALDEFRAAEESLRSMGPENQFVPRVLNNIAAALLDLNRPEEALEILREVDARLLAADVREDASQRLRADLHRAEALRQMGQGRQAEQILAEVVAIARENQRDRPAAGVFLARALESQGALWLEQDRAGEAVTALERSVSLWESLEGDPGRLAGARFLLARALGGVAGGSDRSRQLARQAREVFVRDERFADSLEKVEAWLAAHNTEHGILNQPLGSETAWQNFPQGFFPGHGPRRKTSRAASRAVDGSAGSVTGA